MSKTKSIDQFRRAVAELRDGIDAEHRPALQRAERAFGDLRQQASALQRRLEGAEAELRAVRQEAQTAKQEAERQRVRAESLAQKVLGLETELHRWRSNRVRWMTYFGERRIRVEAYPTVLDYLSLEELRGHIAEFVGVFDDAHFESPTGAEGPWRVCQQLHVERVGRDLMAVPFLRDGEKTILCVWRDELAEDVPVVTGEAPVQWPDRALDPTSGKVVGLGGEPEK